MEVEEISQADTDRDAPSIASEVGSPIPFDVSWKDIFFLKIDQSERGNSLRK